MRADAASQELVGILDGSKETEGVPWPDNFRGFNKFQFENHLWGANHRLASWPSCLNLMIIL